MPALALIAFAYHVEDYQILGASGWASSKGYDITFTPDKAETPLGEAPGVKSIEDFMGRNAERMQAVLRDRFSLVLRAETRELPIYTLTVAKSGHKLSPHNPARRGPSLSGDGHELTGTGVPVSMLAQSLSRMLNRPVRDEAHIDGDFDFKLDWAPDSEPAAGPSIFTALNDQLGLRLESTKGPVQVYVVEKVERPSEN